MLGGYPRCSCKRINSFSLKLAAIGELEKISESCALLFFEGFAYGSSPIMLYKKSLVLIVSTFVGAMG
tara:strand:+ start:179 stop:382 length:204 start_codon:yes stop_codon:yes gene_type:complete